MRRSSDETNIAEPERLFILGAPRSGTTFLASLLRTTRFSTPIESHFVTKYLRRIDAYEPLAQFENFNRLINDILSERPIMQWKLQIDVAELHSQLMKETDGISYSTVVDALFMSRAGASARNAWSDKTPHYLGDVSKLERLFPSARYLYIVRDGRDVAQSLVAKPWGPNNVLVAAEYWKRLNTDDGTLRRLESEGKLLFVRYEELMEDISGGINNIGNFLSENFSSNEITRLASSVRPENALKWKSSMSHADVKIFEAVASDALVELGYEIRFGDSTISNWKRLMLHSHDRVMWLRFMFVSNIVDGFKIKFLGKEPFAE